MDGSGHCGYKAGSRLERILASGRFAVTAEVGMPRGCDPEWVRKRAQRIKGLADAYNLTDNQTAVARLSSLAGAAILKQEGLEPVMQITCRDRNRLAIQADLLGAAALDIKNVLCIAGDHPAAAASSRFASSRDAKNVYDLDSVQLLSVLRDMRDRGVFVSGDPLEGDPPRFFIGAAWSPLADPREFRPRRLAKKIAAGADFIQTQAVYDVAEFKKSMAAARDLGLTERVRILAGIIAPPFAAMLRNIQKRVPGIIVPDRLIRRMEQAGDEFEEGTAIAVELIEELHEVPGLAGVHIQTIEVEDRLPPVVKRAGLLPRPDDGNII